ncbi:MAG: hypothetical protein IT269_13285, partial [Saprospiraceae bacterium]|nr:hypothetical protein [Saprospiraceae bacterium]
MNTFQAACNYQLDPSLNSILGMRLSVISSNQCHVALLDPIELNCYGEFHLIAFNENTGLKTRVMLVSKGHESLAGDLYGMEVSGVLSGRQADNPSLST